MKPGLSCDGTEFARGAIRVETDCANRFGPQSEAIHFQAASDLPDSKIPDKLGAHLDAAARQRRVSKSQIIREAIMAVLRKKKPALSAFDLIKDACGIIQGGPKDYASDSRHLREFGK